jgi:hypothetical protein
VRNRFSLAHCGVESWPIDLTNTNAAPHKVYHQSEVVPNSEPSSCMSCICDGALSDSAKLRPPLFDGQFGDSYLVDRGAQGMV